MRKRPLALGTDYCTSPITSIVCLTLNESSEEGRGGGGVFGDQTQRGITYYFPQRPQWSYTQEGLK